MPGALLLLSTLGILANVSAIWKRLVQSPGGCVISFLCKQKACYLHCVQLWDVVCVCVSSFQTN